MTITDQKIETIVANLLRAGVMLSAAVILTGGIGFMLQHGHQLPSYHTFHGEPPEYRNVTKILQGALHLEWPAVIQLGLLLLIATPVARVAFSVVAFAVEKDRTYVAITLVVLAILVFGLIAQP